MIRASTILILCSTLLLGACETYDCCEKDHEKEKKREYVDTKPDPFPGLNAGHQVDGHIKPKSAWQNYDPHPYPHQPYQPPPAPDGWYQ